MGNAAPVELLQQQLPLAVVVAEAVAVGLLLRLLVEHNIVPWRFALSYYVATDFDRNILLLVERLRSVDLDCYSTIEVRVVAGPTVVQPFVVLAG